MKHEYVFSFFVVKLICAFIAKLNYALRFVNLDVALCGGMFQFALFLRGKNCTRLRKVENISHLSRFLDVVAHHLAIIHPRVVRLQKKFLSLCYYIVITVYKVILSYIILKELYDIMYYII